MRTPLVIAHRGDSSRGLENSLEAFRLALEIPADLIELDLRMTRDNDLYVMHDRDTGRTAEQNIDLERSLSRDVAEVRLRNGERLPRLDDAIGLAKGRAGVNIEIKSAGAGSVLARRLKQSWPQASLVVSSFHEAEVSAVRKELPGIPAALIYDTFSLRHVPGYAGRGYPLISLRKNAVTEHLVRAFHSRSIGVYVWTVDDEDVMRRLISWDVDGIYTNRPLALRKLIEKMKGK